jgi:hypothetical protein
LTLSKVGSGSIYLGVDGTVTPASGFLWEGSAPLSLPTVTALFGILVGDSGGEATTATVSYAETY